MNAPHMLSRGLLGARPAPSMISSLPAGSCSRQVWGLLVVFVALSLGDKGSLVWSAYGAAQRASTRHVHWASKLSPNPDRDSGKITAQQVSASTASTVGSLGVQVQLFRYSSSSPAAAPHHITSQE